MKKQSITGISVMVLLVSFLSGCGNPSLPLGEYTFEDIMYFGHLSSATRDFMIESKSGTEYSIQNDSLRIVNNDNEITCSNITYKREKLTDRFIEKNYQTEEIQEIADFFDQYIHRYRFSLFDEYGEQIHSYIYLMDDELFISRFAGDDILIFSIDKIVKNED